LTLAQVVATTTLRRGFALTALSDVIEALVLLTLLVALGRNAALSRGRLRSFWVLQMTGWFFWFVDQCWWILYDVFLRKPIPPMFFGDVMLFLAGVPMVAGLLLRPNVQQSKQSARLGMADFLLLMLWWLYCYVFLVMCWKYVLVDTALYNQNFDRLYQVEALVLVIVLGLLVQHSEGAWRRFYVYFLAAALFNGLSVVAEYRAVASKDYYNGSWHDIPFLASIAFFIIVPIRGRSLATATMSQDDKNYGIWMERLAVTAMFSMPIVILILLGVKGMPPEIVRFRVVITAGTMIAMSALVYLKQRRLHQELRKTNQTLEEACMTDPLTGIRNRRFFSAIIQGDVAETIRTYAGRDRSCRDLVFYLIDLDDFKEVNDLYGHDAGDRVLVEAVRRITSAIRASDVLMRWGGEEFLVVSRLASRKDADILALRVLQVVREEPYAVSPTHKIRRTCSIGWAAFPWLEDNVSGMDYEEVLGMADRALAQAKRAGKDQSVGMTPELAAANPPKEIQSQPIAASVKP
jgi:diguanylate cyclase (GGDEF)-like protein